MLVDALSWIRGHCFGVLGRECLIIDKLKMLTNLLLIEMRLALGLRLHILRAVAVHGEEGHPVAALGVNCSDFLL